MADSVLDQILTGLRGSAQREFPHRGELKNIRLVGHTPKSDHFIYDVCADFDQGTERIAVKVYRPHKCSGNARGAAEVENGNLQYVNQVCVRKKLTGIPRVLGDFSHDGAVVAEKVCGLPLQSIIMK